MSVFVRGTTSANTAQAEEQMATSGTLGSTAWNTANLTTAAMGAFIHMHGRVINGATPGAVQLQHAKVTSGTATVYAGSYLRAVRIA